MLKSTYIVLFAVGALFTISCDRQAESVMESPDPPASSKIEASRITGGDDDEDEFIIQIQVVNEGNGSPIVGATVDHFRSGTSTPAQSDTTDAQGRVSFSVTAGDYFEQISASGFPVYTTPVFSAQDTLIAVEL